MRFTVGSDMSKVALALTKRLEGLHLGVFQPVNFECHKGRCDVAYMTPRKDDATSSERSWQLGKTSIYSEELWKEQSLVGRVINRRTFTNLTTNQITILECLADL